MRRLDDSISAIAYILESLIVLRDIYKTGDCNNCRNGECEWKPKPGQMVRYNCPHYVGVSCGGKRESE